MKIGSKNYIISIILLIITLILFISGCKGPSAETLPMKANLYFSEIPSLNKPVQLSAKFVSNSAEFTQIVHDVTYRIILPEGFEIVNGDIESISDFDPNSSYSMKVTVKAVKTGNWDIEARADYNFTGGHLGGNGHLYVSILENGATISSMPPHEHFTPGPQQTVTPGTFTPPVSPSSSNLPGPNDSELPVKVGISFAEPPALKKSFR
jgi:hypothetical protein